MKQRHTMAKRAREQAVRERRERKEEKKRAAREAKLGQQAPEPQHQDENG
jgi:hypothetical protein